MKNKERESQNRATMRNWVF